MVVNTRVCVNAVKVTLALKKSVIDKTIRPTGKDIIKPMPTSDSASSNDF